ncbi:winged helix-turn-helix domain-containing protein [Halegenticoccus soli]|uniref:winged helix-turn-helix domain-containing protein n=1 Tax=Halegenticoccus soli TaxID=1985678 RepID=UPI00117BC0D3|nr:winged helix-turn-helix domain-containing protein [Halegenticoccus soli]
MPPDSPERWPDDMDSEDRVRAVAEMLTHPRSASWVADQANVNYKTARKYLAKLADDKRLLTTDRGQKTLYYPNPREQFFGEIGDLVDEHTKDELTAELNAISSRIEAWQDEYDVEDADELRTTLDESLRIEERRERERVIDTWEYNLEMRTLIRHAIRLYDDLHQFTATHSLATSEATTNG